MRGRLSKYSVRLNWKPRKRLERVVRRRSARHWMVSRAKIVLLSHEGKQVSEICAALSLDHQVVRRWLKRYREFGFDGLKDRCRSGRPPEIKPKVWEKVATLVVHGLQRRRRALAVLVAVPLYAAFDELTQPLVGRSTGIHDWIMDLCGALLAMAAVESFLVLRRGRTMS